MWKPPACLEVSRREISFMWTAEWKLHGWGWGLRWRLWQTVTDCDRSQHSRIRSGGWGRTLMTSSHPGLNSNECLCTQSRFILKQLVWNWLSQIRIRQIRTSQQHKEVFILTGLFYSTGCIKSIELCEAQWQKGTHCQFDKLWLNEAVWFIEMGFISNVCFHQYLTKNLSLRTCQCEQSGADTQWWKLRPQSSVHEPQPQWGCSVSLSTHTQSDRS